MAKPHQLIRVSEISRDHLLGIPGVGARNVSKVESKLESFFANGGEVSALTVEDIAESGVISESAAEEIVAWAQRHVEDNGRPEAAEEEFEWDDEPAAPVYALAFDPADAIHEASRLLEDHPDAPALHARLDAVEKWLRGEVAPYKSNGVPA